MVFIDDLDNETGDISQLPTSLEMTLSVAMSFTVQQAVKSLFHARKMRTLNVGKCMALYKQNVRPHFEFFALALSPLDTGRQKSP